VSSYEDRSVLNSTSRLVDRTARVEFLIDQDGDGSIGENLVSGRHNAYSRI